jgi:hypothetical protein
MVGLAVTMTYSADKAFRLTQTLRSLKCFWGDYRGILSILQIKQSRDQ